MPPLNRLPPPPLPGKEERFPEEEEEPDREYSNGDEYEDEPGA